MVFLIGCIEGQLPHSRTTDPKAHEAAPVDLDEERRLFYVGITRARDRLYLTAPRKRMLRGKTVDVTPSRYMDELPEKPKLAKIRAKAAAREIVVNVFMGA